MTKTRKKGKRRRARPVPLVPDTDLNLQGYLDNRSTRHVAGWLRNLDDATEKVAFEVVLPFSAGVFSSRVEILATGIADRASPLLVAVGVGDGVHAFHAEYNRIVTESERMRIEVRATGTAKPIEHAPDLQTAYRSPGAAFRRIQGYLDACTTHHVAGWVRDIDNPAEKLILEVVRQDAADEIVLYTFTADRFSKTLVEIGVGDGVHAFQCHFDPPLADDVRDRIEIRVVATGTVLSHAPEIICEWQPIAHLAMDIVNNCNLRCPFCVVDYSTTRATKLMADATFDAALRLIPYVTDGNFWLSCLHEATLHPKLLDFIARVPRAYRHKLYYTTNLAKRMPDSYFAGVCDAGMHHLNISVESLDPAVYEKMRAGARFPIFMENWDKLLAHHATGSAPPPLRYNIMCYRSNLQSIPALVQTLLDEKRAWQVELRHTYDVAHIPADFRKEEFLTTEEWLWIKAQLAHHDPSRVVLLLPPGEQGYDGTAKTPPADPDNDDGKFSPFLGTDDQPWNHAPRPFNLSMSWDGVMRVYGWKPVSPGQPDRFITYAKTNIHFLNDPLAYLSVL